jgi:hypothetical protein
MIHLLAAKLLPWAVGIRWRAVAAWGAAGAFVLLLIYCYLQHVALAQNQLVYRNPAIIKQTRTVRWKAREDRNACGGDAWTH